jgi:hypothetical protein
MFDSLFAPILLYGNALWSVGKNENIEKVHLQCAERILAVRVTTPNCLVYGGLGRCPLDINIKCRILCFWGRLMTTEKLSSKIYKLLFKLYANGNSQTLYVKHILNILDNIGLSCIFRNQTLVNIIGIKTHVKQILIDQFIQNWRSEIGNSSRCILF